jgi:hypothetical protein
MNIFLLLYADDTVQMAETPKDLQKQLHIFIVVFTLSDAIIT